MQPTTVRFAADSFELVQEAANRVGCTVAMFVREAAIARALLVLKGNRDSAHLPELLGEINRLAQLE